MAVLHGEYWFKGSGVWCADGGAAGLSHEEHVISMARCRFFDEIEEQACGDFLDDKSFCEVLGRRLQKDGIALPDVSMDAVRDGLIQWKSSDAGINYTESLCAAAFDETDLRQYAMREWGWKWCKSRWVGTHSLKKEDFDKIADGMTAAAAHEKSKPKDSETVEIAVTLTGKSYTVPWTAIRTRNYECLPVHEAEPFHGPSAQVKNMDMKAMHSCYTRLGD